MGTEIICSRCKKEISIGYFGIGEPDIKPIPLCEKCKIEMQMEIFDTLDKHRRGIAK